VDRDEDDAERQHFEPVEAGQHPVEHDEVDLRFDREASAFLAVGGHRTG
jgi:hypothetical protein